MPVYAALPLAGGTLSGALNFAPEVNLASSATPALAAANSNCVFITGTTGITGFATAPSGVWRTVRFQGALQLTHSASLRLPGAANIITQANDTAVFQSLGSGNWVCLQYTPYTGKAVVPPALRDLTHSSSLANAAVYWNNASPTPAPQTYPTTARGRALVGGARGADLFKILSADDTGGLNVNSAQPWFPTAGAVAVEAATTYFFEGHLRLSRAAGTTSHTTAINFGGSASLTNIDWFGMAKELDANDLQDISGFWATSASSLVLKAASTSATEQSMFRVWGVVRINAAGTFIPRFQYSAAPGGTPTILRGSYFRMFPIGSNTVTEAGTWS